MKCVDKYIAKPRDKSPLPRKKKIVLEPGQWFTMDFESGEWRAAPPSYLDHFNAAVPRFTAGGKIQGR